MCLINDSYVYKIVVNNNDIKKLLEIKGIKEKIRPELLEELEDCLAKVTVADHEKDRFHFSIVM